MELINFFQRAIPAETIKGLGSVREETEETDKDTSAMNKAGTIIL